MSSMFICNYDQILRPRLAHISWEFIQNIDCYDRHGNTFALVSRENPFQVIRESTMIPYRYLISSSTRETIITKDGDFLDSYASRLEAIEFLLNNSSLCIKEQEIYTLGILKEDFSMIEKYNGYTVPDAPECFQDIALGLVDGPEQMLELIKTNQAIRRKRG